MSYKSRLAAEKAKEAETKSQWNDSVSMNRKEFSAEDRLAQKIAQEVLRDNAKLRGIHSGASIKHILEREAKRQLQLEKI
jgi:thiamine biosynthesis protein ThiC